MIKFLISGALVAFLFLTPLVVFFTSPDRNIFENERRTVAPFPKPPEKVRLRFIQNFLQELTLFFADSFPLRAALLNLPMTLYEASGDNLDMNKSYRGKENWLFLGNQYGRCVDKLQGSVAISKESLRKQTEHYKEIDRLSTSLGADFVIFIGPNKSSVYPEYLPPVIIPSPKRFISPLVASLREAGIKVYDPTDRLVLMKKQGLLYYRTDTHWNLEGSHQAFEGFRDYMKLPELPPFKLIEAPAMRGDLVNISGYRAFPITSGDNYELSWDTLAGTEKKKESDKNIWVIGDSFMEALRPYISATFKAPRFFSSLEKFDRIIAGQPDKPDLIVWVIVERNFAND